MDNLNLLCQTIRFQRTALQNSLAMISAVQQHGESFLKTTLKQSPWILGEGKDAFLFWTQIWRKNLTGVGELVDKNLATMERLTSTGRREARPEKPPREKPAAEPAEPPQPSVAGKKMAEKKQAAEKPPTEEKEMPPKEKETPPKEKEQTAMQTAMTKAETEKAHPSEPPEKKPEHPQGKHPAEKKKPSEPKS